MKACLGGMPRGISRGDCRWTCGQVRCLRLWRDLVHGNASCCRRGLLVELLAGRGALLEEPLVAVTADAVNTLLVGGSFAGLVAEIVLCVPLLALGQARQDVVVRCIVPHVLEHLIGFLFGVARLQSAVVVGACGGEVFGAMGHLDSLVTQENESDSFDAMRAFLPAGCQQCGECQQRCA